jgi:hypothetical protein
MPSVTPSVLALLHPCHTLPGLGVHPQDPLLRSQGPAGPLPQLVCFSRKEQGLLLRAALPRGTFGQQPGLQAWALGPFVGLGTEEEAE